MGGDEVFGLAPALVPTARAPLWRDAGGPAAGLVLIPVYGREISSRPMMFPPFVIRLPYQPGLTGYPLFPAAE